MPAISVKVYLLLLWLREMYSGLDPRIYPRDMGIAGQEIHFSCDASELANIVWPEGWRVEEGEKKVVTDGEEKVYLKFSPKLQKGGDE